MLIAFVSRSTFARQVPIVTGAAPIFGSLARLGVHSSSHTSRIASQLARFNTQRSFTAHAGLAPRSVPLKTGLPFLYTAIGVASVGLGLSVFVGPKIYCDSASPQSYAGYTPRNPPPPPPPPPTSTVNLYELSFGTVCGLCAGVFIKKGAKAVAFLLGGAFVLLQYLGSTSIIRIDWAKMASRFENLFYTKDPITGQKKAPSMYSLWRWLVDFLTADFQQRASFIAGMALGLRIG